MSYTLVLEWMPGDLYMSAVTARCTAPTSSYSVVWLPPNKVYQITLYCGSTSLVSFLVGAFRGKAWSYMTAKEYLSQARLLDARINAKIQQVSALNDLATHATATLTGMPRNPSRSESRMAEAVVKIIDLQNEINHDIDELVDLKREITRRVKSIPNTEYQLLLEKRYLCFMPWEKIAVDMGYSIQHIYRLHDWALREFPVPQET